MRRLALIATLMLFVASCSLAAAPTATPTTPATSTAPANPTIAPSPTPTRPPTATVAPPAATPTATVIPTATPIPPVGLIRLQPGSLVHPLDAVVIGQTVFAIDSGKLKAIDMASGALRIVAPADGMVDKHPIQDLTALAYSDAAKTLYLLDRSGAVYGWDMAARWWLEREAGNNSDTSQEYPVALAADSNGVYLLDTNNGSIWRRSDSGWKTLITSPQLEEGIQMVADGDIFILVGERPKQPARLLRLHGASLSAIDVQGGMESPTRLELGPPEGRLLLVDQGLRRACA